MRKGGLLFTLAITLTIACSGCLAAGCSLPELEDRSSEDAECLFYVGTKNYRERNYAAAFGSWERLRTLEGVPAELQEYKVLAHNNLGYLLYMGLGTRADTRLAIAYWRRAFDAGHDEAAYHLCHTHGDPERPEYSPKVALGYCEEALRRYGKSPDTRDAETVGQLHQYVARLKPR